MSTVAGLLLLAVAGQGMPDMGGKAQIAAMEKMSFCLGEWEGSGWASVGGRKSEFKSTEVVTKEAGGTIFAVRGKHWVEIPGRDPLIIHDAFGMISFDQNSKKFEINSHLATGATGKFEIQAVDSGYTWSTPGSNGATNEYEAKFTTNTWVEKGYEVKGDERTQWFEMSLKKVK